MNTSQKPPPPSQDKTRLTKEEILKQNPFLTDKEAERLSNREWVKIPPSQREDHEHPLE